MMWPWDENRGKRAVGRKTHGSERHAGLGSRGTVGPWDDSPITLSSRVIPLLSNPSHGCAVLLLIRMAYGNSLGESKTCANSKSRGKIAVVKRPTVFRV